MSRQFHLSTVVACLFLLVAGSAFSHSGGTDRYGGHHNRKTGGYHYHNAGRVHAAGNPYQNHKTCGICSTSKQPETSQPKVKPEITVTADETIKALQAGLKCLGYKITSVDGNMGKETKAAIRAFIDEH